LGLNFRKPPFFLLFWPGPLLTIWQAFVGLFKIK